MSHNGIDIDEYILLIIYPSIVFFTVGFISKKKELSKVVSYILQSIICFAFSIAYYFLIPRSGALGLALILGLFGILLLIIARKEKINPSEENELNEKSNTGSSNVKNDSSNNNDVSNISDGKIKRISSDIDIKVKSNNDSSNHVNGSSNINSN